jgi:hypothetical protein
LLETCRQKSDVYEIVAPDMLGRVWLQGIVNGEWDSYLFWTYDFMCGGKLGGGDVEAV